MVYQLQLQQQQQLKQQAQLQQQLNSIQSRFDEFLFKSKSKGKRWHRHSNASLSSPHDYFLSPSSSKSPTPVHVQSPEPVSEGVFPSAVSPDETNSPGMLNFPHAVCHSNLSTCKYTLITASEVC